MSEKLEQIDRYIKTHNIKSTYTIKDKSFILNNNFVIAQMKDSNGAYRYFYDRKEKIIKMVRDNPDTFLFEVSNNPYPKVYFDIDKIEMDKESIEIMIKELIAYFNQEFNRNIIFDDVIIIGKKIHNKNKYKSIHIIFKNVSICKKILKWFVIDYNKINKVKLDERVYKSIQNLCCNHHTKYNESNNATFKDIFKSFNDTDYYIDESTQDTITNHERFINESTQEIERVNSLQILTSRDKNIIKVNSFNIVEHILNVLPSNHEFYNSNYWCGFLLTLKENNVKNIKLFLEESIGRATTPHNYNITDNTKFYKNNTTTYTNIYTQLIQFNKKYNQRFYWVQSSFYDTPELREWVAQLSNLDIKIINYKFDELNAKCMNKPTKLTIDKNIYLDLTNLIIIDNTRAFSACYWNDFYKKSIQDNTRNFIKTTKEEIAIKSLEFIDNKNKIICVKMVWGAGKSHFVMKPAIKKLMKYDNIKILMITENNALNKDVFIDYNNLYKGRVWSHVNKHQDLTDDYNIYLCSIESITLKLKNIMDFDYIIFDEYETIVSHLESSTLGNPHETINNIVKKIDNAKKIYLLDADLSNDRINPLLKTLNTDKVELYECVVNDWRTHHFNIYNNNKNDFIYKLCHDIENNKRVAIACLSKKEAKIIFNMINNKYNNVNILTIWSGEKYYKINGLKKRLLTKEESELSINDMINKYGIDVWLYSPCVITGISYNKLNYFNSTYLLTNNNSCNARLCIQMLFRVRYLIDKEINIYLQELKPITEPPTEQEIIIMINNIIELSKKELDKEQIPKIDIENTDYNNIYHEFYKTNYRENYMSKYNLGQEILRILTTNHQIPLKFIIPNITDLNLNLIKNEYKKVKAITNDEEIEIFRLTQYKNERQIKQQEEYNKTDTTAYISMREVNKKYALIKTGLNHSYYKKINNRVHYFDKIGAIYELKDNYDYKDNNDNKYCNINKQYIKLDNNYNYLNKKIKIQDIKITPFNHLEFIHDSYDTANYLTNSTIINTIDNINNYNKFIDEKENNNNEVNDIILKRIKYKKYKLVLTKIFPELFDEYNNIKFINLKFNYKEFVNRLKPFEQEIKDTWGDMVDIDKHKKKIDKLDINKLKDIETIYYFIKRLLTDIGFILTAPHNKFRDTDFYKLTYERYIKTDYINNRVGDEFRIKDDKLTIDGIPINTDKYNNIVSKSNTLKPKLYKELGYKDKQDKLYFCNGVYRSKSIKNIKVKTIIEDKKFKLDCVKQAILFFYCDKIRLRTQNNLEEEYNKNRVLFKKNKYLEDEFNDECYFDNSDFIKDLNKIYHCESE